MQLDGDEIQVGDRLYHLSTGYGTVETVLPNETRVRMDYGGQIYSMHGNGQHIGKKLFYWYPPAMITPRKGKAPVHERAIRITETIINLLEQ